MKAKEARALKVGDRVRWTEPSGMVFTTHAAEVASSGSVVEKGYSGFKVKWDDGLVAAYRNDHTIAIHKATS